MSVLSGAALLTRLKHDQFEKRLVVSPLLEPSEQLKASRASIDVRLGFEFALILPSLISAIDEFDSVPDGLGREASLSNVYSRQYVSFGSEIVIHPHQFILAGTLEYLRLPLDLMAYVVGRSTWGRLGLTVATAIGIHPGFAGVLTLELRNLGEAPLTLYPGDVVAQLFFHSVEEPSAHQGDPGQYIGTVDLLPRTVSPTITSEKLRRLRLKKRHS